MPPALVDRLPPMVQEPSEASDSGNRRSTLSAASCDLLQGHAGLDDHGVGCGVDLADRCRAAAATSRICRPDRVGDLAADEAGVAALRHDLQAAPVGEGARWRRLPASSRGARRKPPCHARGRAARSDKRRCAPGRSAHVSRRRLRRCAATSAGESSVMAGNLRFYPSRRRWRAGVWPALCGTRRPISTCGRKEELVNRRHRSIA